MDDFSDTSRLSQLSVDPARKPAVSKRYTAIIRSLRFILPLFALVLTVILLTWGEGRRVEPLKKEDLMPQAENIQNELLKPTFSSVDEKNQPYSVTADRASQNRENPDLIELEKPVANLAMNDGTKLEGQASAGLYEQKSQKLNLEGAVKIAHSNGYTLSTEELRVDMATQQAWSGQNVHIAGPDGTLDATGLEGGTAEGTLVFTGPAKIILYSDSNILLPSPKEQLP